MSLIDITTEIGKSIIALVDAKTGGAPDKETIVSSDGKVSAVGVKESNNNKAIKTWVGTLEEYEALETIDENTLYTITDDIEGDEVFNTTKVNLDGSNYVGSALSNVVEETHWNNKITNCITEIPQRIKLELEDGVLTLKAGSEVIIPNGFEEDGTTPKFDYVIVESDQSLSTVNANTTEIKKCLVYLRDSIINGLGVIYTTSCSSGVDAPTGLWHMWYDTSENLVKKIEATAGVVEDYLALPLAEITCTNNSIVSIDQVFNGMGYIGTTVWVDKGVKGLIPNGRNEDGSLKNTEMSLTHLIQVTWETPAWKIHQTPLIAWRNNEWQIHGSQEVTNLNTEELSTNNYFYYDKYNNKFHLNLLGEALDKVLTIGNYAGVNLVFKQPFQAVNYSDSSWVSSQSMPSDKYIDLTLGSSGAHYTAPANGWVTFSRTVADTQFIAVGLVDSGIAAIDTSSGTQTPTVSCPVRRGEKFSVTYSGTGTTNHFRFVYAEGEV